MASGDYRSCDVCGCKCFYDANLNYEHLEESWDDVNQRIIKPKGGVLYNGEDSFLKVDYLGAWAVLCDDCSKTHEARIVPKEGQDEQG